LDWLLVISVTLAFVLVGWWVGREFILELRVQHTSEWKHLGSPDPSWSLKTASEKDERRFSKFMLTRKYAKLGNRRLTRLGDSFNLLWLAWFVVWVLWLIFGHDLHFGPKTAAPFL
jgi:hypothetical protein